jgi:hypothetical protein
LLEEVLKESKNKPFLADVFYPIPNPENQPLSPQKANAVRLFSWNKTLTCNELAFFVLLK